MKEYIASTKNKNSFYLIIISAALFLILIFQLNRTIALEKNNTEINFEYKEISVSYDTKTTDIENTTVKKQNIDNKDNVEPINESAKDAKDAIDKPSSNTYNPNNQNNPVSKDSNNVSHNYQNTSTETIKSDEKTNQQTNNNHLINQEILNDQSEKITITEDSIKEIPSNNQNITIEIDNNSEKTCNTSNYKNDSNHPNNNENNKAEKTTDNNISTIKNESTLQSSKINKETDMSDSINGWRTENGKEYYYINGVKQKDTYIDYHYLNKEGEKTEKIGDFSATLYGSIAWTNQNVNIRSKATQASTKIGAISHGAKLTILSAEDPKTKYIKIKYNNQTGYVYSNFLMINLPDIIPDMYYEITNANGSIYHSAGYNINGITGTNLYGFTKKYNPKIGKDSYYAPLLYPVAKQLQQAYNIAKSQNYNLKVYDSYRPYQVTTKLYNNLYNLYQNNRTVKQKINYDNNGNYWGPSWFLAKSYSSHNRGVAIDISLTDAKGNELAAQSLMHTLDTSSIVSYNNSVSNKLKTIMTSAGFETLKSEWWHFEEKDYKNSPVNNFLLS